eukprot:COSAG01_NODE_4807_length_4725_cov_2.316915_2_plen_922_part_00
MPTCNARLHGDLLLLNVGGTDSKYSCETSHGKYSWIGPASDGGYFGSDMRSFLAAVITHAPGVFMCSMGASVAVSTSVDLVVGQHATLQGASANLTAHAWRYFGDEAAFVLQAGAALKIGGVAVASSSGLAFRISAGATITTSALQLLSAGVSSAIQCAVLASGIGRQGLACDPVVGLPGVLRIGGPLIITTSGMGFGTGSTQYIGENYEQFRVAVSRTSGSLAGFYTLQLKQDTVVSTVGLMIQSTMHVSIIGDDSRPTWQFPGSGSAFTVQNAGFLNLRRITLSKPRVIAGAAPILVVNLGGQATIDTSTLTNVGITAHGTFRLASSQLTDVQLLSDHGASVSLDTVTVIGTSHPLVLPVSCTMTVSGSQLNNVRLQVDATGHLTLSHTVFRIVGVVATVATGGSMTVSSSQLVHGSATDPFPCDGHDMHCTGPHAQAVTLSGPASINTNAPLICPPGGGDCLYGYVDMASCLADIATGMSSCFVYLQHDSPAMRTLSVSAGQYFEVHGQASGAAAQLALHADWSVAGSGSLLLGTLQLGGGSGSGGTHLTVATGGWLTLQTVTMTSSTVAFSGSVTVTGSTLTLAHLSGTSGQLSLSGGTLTGSTVQLAEGTAAFGGSCVLINTPVSVSGAAGAPQALLGVSQCELRGDGTAVPLTVGAAAMATVTQTTFRSTAGSVTAVSVAAGGNLTVGSSQLVCDSQTGACLSMPPALVAAGVTAEQFAARLGNGVDVRADAVCFGAYHTVPDNPRVRTSAGRGYGTGRRSDCPRTAADSTMPNTNGAFGLGQPPDAWYRLPTGRGLAGTPPGPFRCSSSHGTGWLSGFGASAPACYNGVLYGGTSNPRGLGCPGDSYSVNADGTLPPLVGVPPADGTVCFDYGPAPSHTCYNSVAVRAVECGAFSLWQLPPLPMGICSGAYCLA